MAFGDVLAIFGKMFRQQPRMTPNPVQLHRLETKVPTAVSNQKGSNPGTQKSDGVHGFSILDAVEDLKGSNHESNKSDGVHGFSILDAVEDLKGSKPANKKSDGVHGFSILDAVDKSKSSLQKPKQQQTDMEAHCAPILRNATAIDATAIKRTLKLPHPKAKSKAKTESSSSLPRIDKLKNDTAERKCEDTTPLTEQSIIKVEDSQNERVGDIKATSKVDPFSAVNRNPAKREDHREKLIFFVQFLTHLILTIVLIILFPDLMKHLNKYFIHGEFPQEALPSVCYFCFYMLWLFTIIVIDVLRNATTSSTIGKTINIKDRKKCKTSKGNHPHKETADHTKTKVKPFSAVNRNPTKREDRREKLIFFVQFLTHLILTIVLIILFPDLMKHLNKYFIHGEFPQEALPSVCYFCLYLLWLFTIIVIDVLRNATTSSTIGKTINIKDRKKCETSKGNHPHKETAEHTKTKVKPFSAVNRNPTKREDRREKLIFFVQFLTHLILTIVLIIIFPDLMKHLNKYFIHGEFPQEALPSVCYFCFYMLWLFTIIVIDVLRNATTSTKGKTVNIKDRKKCETSKGNLPHKETADRIKTKVKPVKRNPTKLEDRRAKLILFVQMLTHLILAINYLTILFPDLMKHLDNYLIHGEFPQEALPAVTYLCLYLLWLFMMYAIDVLRNIK